ncbi:MAG: Mrp/NBP35 family ATP-binding protein [Holosporales bacterium]|jgi:ATP-binding protein involved in chromosome partitioning
MEQSEVVNTLLTLHYQGHTAFTQQQISGVVVRKEQVGCVISLSTTQKNHRAALQALAEQALLQLPGIETAQVIFTAETGGVPAQPHTAPARRGAPAEKIALPQIKNIIAVASGKGGVGKSTLAVNLAIALHQQGARVGILDADIYGPSLPMLLGLSGRPALDAAKKMVPLEKHGLACLSIGLLTDQDKPLIWRGPMVMGAIEQMLKDAAWPILDILIIDMPPGTGDAQLTLAQRVPVTGAIIVSTPQDIALIDARKGLKMFEQTGVKILGVIENMSFYCCPQCGHREELFGHGGARQAAAELKVPFLGEVPLHASIRAQSDSGVPITLSQPESLLAKAYQEIAAQLQS